MYYVDQLHLLVLKEWLYGESGAQQYKFPQSPEQGVPWVCPVWTAPDLLLWLGHDWCRLTDVWNCSLVWLSARSSPELAVDRLGSIVSPQRI